MAKSNGSVVVATKEILSTNDYTIFKGMEGNRDVDALHVKRLQKLMLLNGNLTYEFPIVVNQELFVIDGQHRLRALEELGWEVGYVIQDEATIDTVRAINRGQRNWSWRDVANSYAKLGYDDYQWFMWFVETYNLNLRTGMSFATGMVHGGRAAFFAGEMVIADKTRAVKRAEQYDDVREAAGIDNSAFGSAFGEIAKSPDYEHGRMVAKVDQLAATIPQAATTNDYKRKFEDIFNHSLAEENRVRLF